MIRHAGGMNPGASSSPPTSKRLMSIDAYRGFVMLLMMGEVLRLSAVARALPDSGFWSVLAFHQSHVEWIGCSLHDMIQPSFSFLVGVALPFSIASRRARGQGMAGLASHAVIRALLLIGLGIFLRSTGKPMTNFAFRTGRARSLLRDGRSFGFEFAATHAGRVAIVNCED